MSTFKAGSLLVLLLSLAGCGAQVVEFEQDGGTPLSDGGTQIAPTITSTLPVNGATAVAVRPAISATFSKEMDPQTLTTTQFLVRQGATNIAGTVAYTAATRTATFTPTSALGTNLVHTATVNTGAKDTQGLALAADVTWSFTTAVNTLPPTVTSTNPLDLATNVPLNKRPSATFSKAMDPSTLTSLSFILERGATLISGSVSLDGATNTATFKPVVPLDVNTTYTATVTTDAKDLGGTRLTQDHSWEFTTAACGQAPIVLGSAANFAVLAGSTVTNTGPTMVTGDLGVSPGTQVTGFGPGTLIGAEHAGDPIAAQGIADLTTAFNEAAGRTLCAVTVAGDLGGQTLMPGLYKSTSSLEITTADLTLDAQGEPDAVFIFQMASTFTTTSGRQVILAGGAQAKNIFWQVGSSATLGSTTAFQGTIMADQSVTLNTGATLGGRALARIGAVSMDSNTIVRPAP